jgi:hypothetical protein
VAREDQDTPALVASSKVMLEAFVAEEGAGILRGVRGHLAELRQEPAQVSVKLTEKELPFFG